MSKLKKEKTRKEQFLDWTVDLLLYIVILNLFAQFSEDISFVTFTYSIAAAFALKILLVLIIGFEHVVADFWGKFKGKIFQTLSLISTLLILFLSKFVILEVIDFIFRENVEIYGFVTLVLMIITMIASRKLIEYVYKKL